MGVRRLVHETRVLTHETLNITQRLLGFARNPMLFLNLGSTYLHLARHYRLGKRIGAGAGGDVRLATNRTTGEVVALKTETPLPFPLSRSPAEGLRHEAKVLERINAPYVMHAIDSDPSRPSPYVAMPYVDGVSLGHLIMGTRGLETSEALAIAEKVTVALDALHSRGYVHLDLHPGNVLTDVSLDKRSGQPTRKVDRTTTILLTDLGLATERWKLHDNQISNSLVNPPELPEVATTLAHSTLGSPIDLSPFDMWACGSLMYKAFTGKYLEREMGWGPDVSNRWEFAERQRRAVRNKDTTGLLDEIPHEGARKLIGKMLSIDPTERPTAGQALAEVRQLIQRLDNPPAFGPERLPKQALRRGDRVSGHRMAANVLVAVSVALTGAGVTSYVEFASRVADRVCHELNDSPLPQALVDAICSTVANDQKVISGSRKRAAATNDLFTPSETPALQSQPTMSHDEGGNSSLWQSPNAEPSFNVKAPGTSQDVGLDQFIN